MRQIKIRGCSLLLAASPFKFKKMNNPTEDGYYITKTIEGKVGIALWENDKFWEDAHQDGTLKFGIKRGFIIEWKKSPIQPEPKKEKL